MLRRRLGIVVAAGAGRRMGGPKALLMLGGKTLSQLHVEALQSAGCERIALIVRTGDSASSALGFLRAASHVTLVTAPPVSQATSLACGWQALAASLESADDAAVIVTPVDVLPAQQRTYEILLSSLRGDTYAATPTYRGYGGHPAVLCGSAMKGYAQASAGASDYPPLCDTLAALGARRVRVPVADPAVVTDFDTPQQWRTYSVPAITFAE